MNETLKVNALGLNDVALRALSEARYSDEIETSGANTFADGGAQLILTYGRDIVETTHPEGHWFELTPEEVLEIEKITGQALLGQ
jgi:hypothetical protein